MFIPAEFSQYGGGEEIWRWCQTACRRLGQFAIGGTMARGPVTVSEADLDHFDLAYLQHHADLTGQDIKHLCE